MTLVKVNSLFFLIVRVSLMPFSSWNRLQAPLALHDHDLLKRDEEELSGSLRRSVIEYRMPPTLISEV